MKQRNRSEKERCRSDEMVQAGGISGIRASRQGFGEVAKGFSAIKRRPRQARPITLNWLSVAEEAFNVHKCVEITASLDSGGELALVDYTLAD